MSFSSQGNEGIFVAIMSVIFLLIIISVSVASVFLVGFIWAVKNGQYEDDYSPSVRMLFDDEHMPAQKGDAKTSKQHKNKKNTTNNLNTTQPQA